MLAFIQTAAFRGIDTILLNAQVHIANGLPTIAAAVAGQSLICSAACGREYAARVSGLMIDRFDLIIEVLEVTLATLLAPAASETTAVIARCFEAARADVASRPQQAADCANARLQPTQLTDVMIYDDYATLVLQTAIEQSQLSARACHKVQRVARSIADLKAEATISRATIAEALAYRAMPLLA